MTIFEMDDLSMAQLQSWFLSVCGPVDNLTGSSIDGIPPAPLSMDAGSRTVQQVPALPRTGQESHLNHGVAQASTMDGVFSLDLDYGFDEKWLAEVFNPPPDVRPFDESPQNAPVQQLAIDTALLTSPLEAFPPPTPTIAVDIPSNVSQGGPPSLGTPSSLGTPISALSPFPFSFPGSLSSEGAFPQSPLDLRRGSLRPSDEATHEGLMEQGYPGDSPIARERREILRRLVVNETRQLPTHPRDIKKLACIHKSTDDVPDDAQPSSGKKSGSSMLHCLWAGCPHSSPRPDRLKTHVFTHIGFKPFLCDRSCGEPHCTAKFYSKGDCNSHQSKREKKVNCENCGEESTSKNLTRHARSNKCRINGRRSVSYSI